MQHSQKGLMGYSYGLLLILGLIFLPACGSAAARYNNQGNDQFEDEAYDAALEDYTSAKQENPDLPEPYYNAGNAQHRKGDMDSATTQLQQALRSAEDELAQNSFYNLGNTYFKEEDWPAAIEAYKQALLLNPDDEQAKHNLELALRMMQQQQQQQQQQQGQNQEQQQGGQQQQQQQQQGGQNDQDQQQGGGEQPDQQEQDQSGSQPQEEPQPGRAELTPDEAEQLLDALGQDSQTLQERLQQQFGAPAPPPARDW